MTPGSFDDDVNLTSIRMDNFMTLDERDSHEIVSPFHGCANLSEIY
jgi:phage replication-related protein YjqB (UPF0714/DUF867 family)